jgi:molybdate transport system ATP-binding protein
MTCVSENNHTFPTLSSKMKSSLLTNYNSLFKPSHQRIHLTTTLSSTSSSSEWLIQFQNASIRPHLPIHSHSLAPPPIAVKDLTWQLSKGEHWLILGPNGSGKSTFARSIVGKAAVVSGDFRSKIKTSAMVSFAQNERLRSMMNYLLAWEVNLKQENGFTVKDLLQQRVSNNPLLSENEINRFDSFCNFKFLWNRTVDTLSSGELRRILLIHALSCAPELLVLDESFDYIDEAKRDLLSELLNQFTNKNKNTSVLLITHRINDVENLDFLTNLLRFNDKGKIEESGKYERLNSNQNSFLISDEFVQRTQQVVAKSMQRKEKQNIPSDKFLNPYVEMKNIVLEYDDIPVIKNVDLLVTSGSRIVVSGPSGSGKSLLLSMISGENPKSYSNEIAVFGHRIDDNSMTLSERRSEIGSYSPRLCETLFQYSRTKTAMEVVLSGLVNGSMHDPEDVALASEWASLFLSCVGAKHSQTYLTLSQGQRSIVLLARVLIGTPKLLLLDEPFVGMDAQTRLRVTAVLELIFQANPECAVLCTSHYSDDFSKFKQKVTLVKSSSYGPYTFIEA